MRIIVLQTTGGFTSDGRSGGGATHFENLMREWGKFGAEVILITNSADQGVGVRYAGVNGVYKLPAFRFEASSRILFLIGILANPFIQHRAIEAALSDIAIRNRGESIVVATGPYPSDVLGTLSASRRLRIPGVIYHHHLAPPPWSNPLRRRPLIRVLVNWGMSHFALIMSKVCNIYPSLDQPRTLREYGYNFPVEPLVNQNAPPTVRCTSCLLTTPQYHAAFIGRISRYKGVVDLLKAWQIVRWTLPEARLMLAGEPNPSDYDKLVSRPISRLGLDGSVDTQGYVSQEKKVQILHNSRLFVFPSYEEGWSLSVMEAAAHGVVPVVYNLPAYDYLGDDCIRVPLGDIQALAHAISDTLTHHDRTASMAKRVMKRSRGFTLGGIARDQLAGFESIVKSRSEPRGRSTL